MKVKSKLEHIVQKKEIRLSCFYRDEPYRSKSYLLKSWELLLHMSHVMSQETCNKVMELKLCV